VIASRSSGCDLICIKERSSSQGERSGRNNPDGLMGVHMHLSLYSIFDVVHSSILIAGACGWAAWAAKQPDSYSELIKHLTWSQSADC
jgi:hypothetical protein